MIIDCAYYRDGRRQHVEAMSVEEAAASCKAGGFVWLGMFEPTTEELTQVRENFGLHELAVEDAQTFHLRPKVEPYEGDIRLVILRPARYDDEREEVDFGEVSVFVGPAFVITVRQGVASDLHGARLRLEQRPELLEAGTPSVLWAILDQVVDGYGPVVAELERDIEQVEQTVFAGTSDGVWRSTDRGATFRRTGFPDAKKQVWCFLVDSRDPDPRAADIVQTCVTNWLTSTGGLSDTELNTGGLRIVTTLNPDIQNAAQTGLWTAMSPSSQAASGSASPSPGPWPSIRSCSSSTSRSRLSTPSSGRRCRSSCAFCSSAWASPPSSSRTTSARP